ncbi:hypothetical protein JCM17846_28730 [Iodidimonas nitroreducens]|uniref:Uncharacterized protein n=1 Tax=Iodidimonas nitroreducens TaxID=1236968 RepID=A0A5A7N9Z7_9PROT|nr:hypothetical protein JCM17846_28730 [Iodidimonas nitroreducens]
MCFQDSLIWSLPISVIENNDYGDLRRSVRHIGAALRKGVDRAAPARSLTARREASKRRPVKNYVPITDEMRAELCAEFDRTGAGPASLFRGRPASLNGLTEIKISHWRTGRVKRADPTEWAYVADALKSLPSKS